MMNTTARRQPKKENERSAPRRLSRGAALALALSAAFLILVFAVLLELNQNMIVGWVISGALIAGYCVLFCLLSGKKAVLRVLAALLTAALLLLTLILTVGPYRAHPAVDVKNPEKTGVYTVKQGKLTGVYTADRAVEVFCGVPYAKPPVGELRWREPQEPDSWQGVRAADRFAPMSMQTKIPAVVRSLVDIIGYHQYRITAENNYREMMSEDSLYLNIWKPAGDLSGAPVLVYIHGGSLQTGQPWYEDYSGQGLARRGAIVINMGYRLGVYGFFADEELKNESPVGTTGNYGLLDQIMALRWVKENVAAFGGDPENVTLAGESAGAACVSALLTSPLAAGLFRRAVIESSTVTAPSPAHSFRSLEDAYKTGNELKNHFGVTSADELRALSADRLLYGTNDNHHITVDGYVLTETPYESLRKGICNAEEILHGYNESEGALFILLDQANKRNYEGKVRAYFGDYANEVLSLYPAATNEEAKNNWMEIYSAAIFEYGHYCLARQARALGVPAYEYFFTKHNSRLGGNHGGEEAYFYDNLDYYPKHYDKSDRALEEIMSAYLFSFLQNGDPNADGLPLWEKDPADGTVFELGEEVRRVPERATALFGILDRMNGFETTPPAEA